MTLTLNERFPVAHPTDEVWSNLADIAFVAECFPGATLERELPDGGHEGSLALRLGPTKARFSGVLHVDFDDATRTATLRAEGSDSRRSRASANATVRLEALDDTTSALDVDVAIEVGGPLGQFARAGGVEVTRTLLGDFATNVDERLARAATIEPAVPAEPAPTHRAAARDDAVRVVAVVVRSARAAAGRAIARVRTWLADRRGRPA